MNREIPHSEYDPKPIDLALLKEEWRNAKYMAELMRKSKNAPGAEIMEEKALSLSLEINKIDPNFSKNVKSSIIFLHENEAEELNRNLHKPKKS